MYDEESWVETASGKGTEQDCTLNEEHASSLEPYTLHASSTAAAHTGMSTGGRGR